MKAQNRSNYLIGTGVVLCSAVLLAALTFALTGFSWRAGGRNVEIDFADATGIKLHSAVKYAGKAAGSVTGIRYLSPEERVRATQSENAVRVKVLLNHDVPRLLEGVSAGLTGETLLGEKFIALTPGDPKGKPLPDGTVIQGSTGASIDAVASSAKEAMSKINDILASLRSDYPSLVPRLAEILTLGQSIMGQGSNLIQNADVTIQNANGAVTQLKTDYTELIPKLTSILSEAQTITTNADHAILKVSALIDRVDGVIQTNEGELSKLLQELRVASQNLKVITTYAKALTATLAEKPSTLIWSRKARSLPDEQTILDSSEPVKVE